jgi:TRAP-type transport system periplasmic protein
MKQRCILIAAALLVVAAPVWGKTTIRYATTLPDGPAGEVVGAKAMKDFIEFRSGGEIEVKIFYGGALGGDRELIEQVQNGQLEMSWTAEAPIANFYAPVQVFGIPYLFSSQASAWNFFQTSPFVRQMAEEMRQKTGLRLVGVAESGFRHITNNTREVKTPADMKGLKMRTMESPVFMRFMQSMGAAATPMAFTEVIMALRQGVVDGQENPANVINAFGVAEVQKFMSLSEHIYGSAWVLTNDAFYKKLTPGERQIFTDGVQVAILNNNATKVAAFRSDIEAIQKKGAKVYINTLAEKDQFKLTTQKPVLEFIAGRVGQKTVDDLLAAVAASNKTLYGD